MTTPDTSGDVAVVKPYYLLEEAYQMGHDEFEDMEPPEDGEFDLGPFYDTARYANVILPDLRAMAGFGDSGKGTYQINRQVAAVHPGCEEDEPAEADMMNCADVFSELSDAWITGALDGWEGTYDPDSVQHWI